MPKITQGNAKNYLHATVKRYTQITKEQAGIILTNNGDISVIGSDPFKEFFNEHRKETSPRNAEISLFELY